MSKKLKGEAGLYQAVSISAARGYKIEPGRFGDEYRDDTTDTITTRVCMCGSVLAATGMPVDEIETMGGENILKAVAKRLGITLKQAASLNNGFEDVSKVDSKHEIAGVCYSEDENPLRKGVDTKWYNIGKELRKEYEGASAS